MWFSVPSALAFMSKMRMLNPGCFPSLRCSLFCGEPLPATSAKAWQQAAPNSIVENLYGPTEATIAITHYRWDGERSVEKSVNGIVPIGWVFEGQKSCVIDREVNVLPKGEIGELCLAGTQVTSGYWNRPQNTKEQFIRLPSVGKELWYRTGDLVREDEDGCLHYVGRMDSQVKIRGHRVELQEIDLVLRKASGAEQAVCLAWPFEDGSADGIVAFICGRRELDEHRVVAYCKKFLPQYMVPRKVYFIDEMPLNVNGKIDRLKLAERLRN
jgi:acyl-CoA synthetase (AMP-forming)/AMP-acid ligase II